MRVRYMRRPRPSRPSKPNPRLHDPEVARDAGIDLKTIATGIWDRTDVFGLFHYPVYKPLMDKLDEIAQELGASRVNFFYDWRTDLWASTPPFTATSEKLTNAIQGSHRTRSGIGL